MPTSQTGLSLLLLFVVGGLMGLTGNVVKLAIAAGWQPLAFLLWSLLGAGLILLAVTALARQMPRLTPPHLRYYLCSGLISLTLPNALLFSAIPHVGAGYASMCLAFPPLITYLLALGLRMEPLRGVRMAGIVAGLLGSLLLAFGKASAGDSPLLWVIAILAAPVSLALGNIYRSRYWPRDTSALSLAPGMILAGALLLSPAALLGVDLSAGQIQTTGAWLLAAQVFLFSGVYGLYFILQKVAGAVFLSQIGSVSALIGASVAIFVLGERGSAGMALAVILIVIGVVLVAMRGGPVRSAAA